MEWIFKQFSWESELCSWIRAEIVDVIWLLEGTGSSSNVVSTEQINKINFFNKKRRILKLIMVSVLLACLHALENIMNQTDELFLLYEIQHQI